MNAKIQELLVEAHRQTKGGIYNGHPSAWSEKFAELIVKECMKLNSKELSITAIERLLPLYKEHFGVKE